VYGSAYNACKRLPIRERRCTGCSGLSGYLGNRVIGLLGFGLKAKRSRIANEQFSDPEVSEIKVSSVPKKNRGWPKPASVETFCDRPKSTIGCSFDSEAFFFQKRRVPPALYRGGA
jgi:hypothetical protein